MGDIADPSAIGLVEGEAAVKEIGSDGVGYFEFTVALGTPAGGTV